MMDATKVKAALMILAHMDPDAKEAIEEYISKAASNKITVNRMDCLGVLADYSRCMDLIDALDLVNVYMLAGLIEA